MFSKTKWISDIDGVEGEIDLDLLTYVERIKFMKLLNLQVIDGEVHLKTDNLDQLIYIKELLDKKVTSVNVLIGSTRINYWDDLQYCEHFQTILNKVSTCLFNGAKIGSP
jgi:hypothetical protein